MVGEKKYGGDIYAMELARPAGIGQQLRVYARPAWRARNPYPGMLADALVAQGVPVSELSYSWHPVPGEKKAILFFHWPDEFFFARNPRQQLRTLLLLANLWWGRVVRRQKIVWLAHNVLPHERNGRPFGFARRGFFAALDGLIFLSAPSRDLLLAAYPALADQPWLVIPHGHYQGRVATPPSLPRVYPAGPVHLAFIGRVKRYKAPDLLASTVQDLPPSTARLVIAGYCTDADLTAELRQAAASAGNIHLQLEYLSDAEIERITDEADAVVLPYRDIVNSGSALLALSRFRPVIAPRLGSLIELQGQVGEDWLWLYDGPLTGERMREGIEWVRNTQRISPPDLSAQDWTHIGEKLARFLRQIAHEPGSGIP
ncbi:MAG TPA: hypothetical protein VIR65_10890 [Rhizorhapis sp.]